MDESTSALDPISTSKIEDLVMELKSQYTIVMVTHNMQQAVRVSDQTAFFLLGDLVEYGDTDQLFSTPKEKKTEDILPVDLVNAGENDTMRNQFDRQLNTLNGELIQMGHMVEQAIEHAIEAMVHQDAEKARKNMEFDAEVDQQEKDIETLCMKLLMKQQPVARDLRLISAALKMITDMERIGDQAADISELSLSLVK